MQAVLLRLRRYLIAGLVIWLPVWVTLWVIKSIVSLMDSSLSMLPAHYRNQYLGAHPIPGIGVLISLLVLMLTGMVGTNFIGKKLIMRWEAFVARIPLVRSIHTGVKQVLDSLLSSSQQSFRRVVAVEYPRTGLWTIGFVTNSGLTLPASAADETLLTVFIPTTPNPTSGFLVMVPKAHVIALDVSVDEALKMVISLGTVLPTNAYGVREGGEKAGLA